LVFHQLPSADKEKSIVRFPGKNRACRRLISLPTSVLGAMARNHFRNQRGRTVFLRRAIFSLFHWPVHGPASTDPDGGTVHRRRATSFKQSHLAVLCRGDQAAEHYEITRCGSLIAWAKRLGRNDCAGVLQKSLDGKGAYFRCQSLPSAPPRPYTGSVRGLTTFEMRLIAFKRSRVSVHSS
jgi:hypothetical protein